MLPCSGLNPLLQVCGEIRLQYHAKVKASLLSGSQPKVGGKRNQFNRVRSLTDAEAAGTSHDTRLVIGCYYHVSRLVAPSNVNIL
jgi:hypothetical protein